MPGIISNLVGDLRLKLRWGSPVQTDIVHYTPQFLPRFRFEYHKAAKRLYIADKVAVGLSVANLIGTDIETEGEAYRAILLWGRGYRAGKEEVSHDDQGKLIMLGGK